MTQTPLIKKIKIAAGHYRIGEFEIVKEAASHAGEDTTWLVYRGTAFASKSITNAVSLADAQAAISKGIIR